MEILREKIKDNRFLRLIENLLKAGYCEEWSYRPTLSGTPQGGIVSPILSNISLDQLDKFVEQTLIPEHTRGQRRAENKEYAQLQKLAWSHRKAGHEDRVHELELPYQRMPSKNVNDPDYRRLSYLRYADDFLLAFIGPIAEAKAIKEKLSTFLKEKLKLDLSEEKTLITHAQTETAKFLGYHIRVQQEDTKHTEGRRSVNGIVGLRVPPQFVEEKSALYRRHGKPTHRPELLDEDDCTIISLYQSEYRGYVQYSPLAQNVAWLNNVRTVMRLSLLKTLANKHKTSGARMRAQYQKTVRLPQGPRKCLEITVEREGKKPLVARFGGIPLKRDLKTQIPDLPTERKPPTRSELLKRLLADTCEVCGAVGNIEVPHIHALKDLKVKGKKELPLWMQIMSARRRKTLLVCRPCHMAIQYGKPTKKHVSK
jgi:hypothetical protein